MATQITTSPKDQYRVIITKFGCTRGEQFINGKFFNEYGEPAVAEENYNVEYSYSGQIVDSNGDIVEDFIGGGDKLTVVNTPTGFPFLALVSSRYGASNNSHTYLLYSTSPSFKEISVIKNPLSKYQANKRKGSERAVEGFCKGNDGSFLIDRLTTEGTKLGNSNASQKWNVETLKLVDGNFISVNIRPYHSNSYQKLKSN